MTSLSVETPLGPGRMLIDEADDPRAVLLLGHGANGALNAFDLVALAELLPVQGISVWRFEQPWKTAGGRVTARPERLDEAWPAALDAVRSAHPNLPLFVGGRSAGARVACRGFGPGQVGVVCLAFPLHLPGKPEKSRIAELAGVEGPVLVLQGRSDTFGNGAELLAALSGQATRPDLTLVELDGGHSFAPRTKAAKAQEDSLRGYLATQVADFITRYQPAP